MLSFFKSGFQKVKKALLKTRNLFSDRLRQLLSRGLSEESFEELERLLYEADLGTELASLLSEEVNAYVKKTSEKDPERLVSFLEGRCQALFERPPQVAGHSPSSGEPLVILLVGVNGSGKTTSAAKLAKLYRDEGKRVLLAAGDTFRAAAIEQLEIWASRLGIDIVKGQSGGDSSAVIFDAVAKAKAGGYDVVIADTAGRLQAKTELMRELEKVGRVCKKQIASAPHETLLVIDATTGQNAIDQTKTFHEFTPLTGLILTKLDGSAKGGIILSIYHKFGIPVRYIGLGEGVDDLAPFDATGYVEALFAK